MSIRIPGRLVGYFTTALELINDAKTVEQGVLGLTMLTVAPEEVENADVSREVQLELKDQLINFSMQFAVLMNQLAEKALCSREFFVALLKQLTAWLPLGMTLSKLHADHHQSFEILCMAVKMTDIQLITEGCGAIKALVVLKEYPRPEKRTEALRALLESVNAQVQTLLAPYQAPSAEGHTIDTDEDSGRALVELSRVLLRPHTLRVHELFAQLGYTPAEVLKLATWDMATYLGQDQSTGSIEKGKLADFFLVPGNPVADLKAIKTIRAVVKDGAVYYPSEVYPHFGIKPFGTAPKVTLPDAP